MVLPLFLALLAAMADTSHAEATPAIVVGAGVSGLKAAADLASAGFAVTVLEARDRTGGRLWTVKTPGGVLDLGAQWIHGTGNPVMELAKAQGWTILKSPDSSMAFEGVSPTVSKELSDKEEAEFQKIFGDFEEFLESQQEGSNALALSSAVDAFKKKRGLTARQAAGLDLLVDNNVVQEYAASPQDLSLNWFNNDASLDGGDQILAQGYSQLTDYLAGIVTSKGGKIVLGAPVSEVSYGAAGVTITAGGKKYLAPFAVISLPLGVLKAGSVKFDPPLPTSKVNAISRLVMGTLNKVILQFPAASRWPDVSWFSRIPLAADGGRWTDFFSLRAITRKAGNERPVIVAFTAGRAALYPASTTDASLVGDATRVLQGMFGGPAKLPAATASWITRWHADPFSLGSYSAAGPGSTGKERKDLAAPTAKRLFWAGEAASKKWPGTVQGAYVSGEAAAAAAAGEHGSKR